MSREIIYGDVQGRQPATVFITPSKPNPWYGSIVEGDRLTAEQRANLASRGIDPRGVEIVTVHREATTRELWWGTLTAPPLYAFDCPVIGHRGSLILVIAPNGQAKHVISFADRFWVNIPRGLKRVA